MTQAPTPGPLSAEDVNLLVKGDLLRVICDTLIGEPSLRIPKGTVVEFEASEQGLVDVQGDFWGHHAFAFIGRPDADGWMTWSGGENPVPGQVAETKHRDGVVYEGAEAWPSDEWFDGPGFWVHDGSDSDIIAFRVAPTAPVEASGSEREHGPKCWGKTSFSDEMMYCYCGSTDSPPGEMREAVLKGVGKVNGDGWKDTTTKGETVFVWNAEKPAPYAPGQYPRVGNEGWSASTLQYDFTPAAADDVPAILAALSTTPARAEAQDEGAAGELVACWMDGAPSSFRAQEWFIAKTTYGDRVVLRALPDEYAYDFKTADETYIKRDKIAAWMPFPDSQYAHPSPPPAADEDRVRKVATLTRYTPTATGNNKAMMEEDEAGLYVLRKPVMSALKSTAAKEGEK